MAKKKTEKEKHPGGRPTKYDENYHPLLMWSHLQCGDTIEEAAKKLDISKDTVYEWAKKYPEFSDAIRDGREKTNSEVEKSLLKRAMGYTYNRVKVETDKSGQVVKKVAETVHVLPDVMAARLWLMNRKSEHWRDKQDVNLSGSVNLVLDGDDEDL